MKKITFLFVLFLLASCGNFKLATLNHTPKAFVTSTGINVDVIDSEFGLYRKFNNDNKFRWDYTQFAVNQDLRWYYSFYNRNFLFKYRRNISPWDLYVNRYDFWFDWNFNYGWRGFNSWDPYGFRNWGWNSWDPYYSNFHIWNRQNIAYAKTRRGSQYTKDIKVQTYIKPEKNETNLRRSINILKGRNNNIKIREYNNPNQLKNDKTIRPDIRGYGRPESSNNGGRSWSRENVPTQPTIIRQSRTVQPGQVRRGSRPPVLQQSRSSQQPSQQRR